MVKLYDSKYRFLGKSKEEIIELHDHKEFGITDLSNWQQEIILKAIAVILRILKKLKPKNPSLNLEELILR